MKASLSLAFPVPVAMETLTISVSSTLPIPLFQAKKKLALQLTTPVKSAFIIVAAATPLATIPIPPLRVCLVSLVHGLSPESSAKNVMVLVACMLQILVA